MKNRTHNLMPPGVRPRTVQTVVVFALLGMLSSAAFSQSGPQTPEDFLGATKQGDYATQLFTFLLGDFFKSPLASIGGSPSLVGALFLIFNSAIFMVGMLWAGYGLLSGIAETADKGEVLGKKQSVVWLPIRMVTGIGGIVPIFSGFSLAQVLIVSMAGLGIGIANMMWTGAVNKANEFTSFVPPSAAATMTGGVGFKDVAKALFTSHVCVLANKELEQGLAATGRAPAEQIKLMPSTDKLALASAKWGSDTNPNQCGGVTILKGHLGGRTASAVTAFRVQSVNYEAYAQQVQSVYANGFGSFSQVVERIATKWYEDRRTANETKGAAPLPFPETELVAAAQAYAVAIQNLQVEMGKKDLHGLNTEVLNRMKEGGWLQAGAWYSTFAEASAALADAMRAVRFEVLEPAKPKDNTVAEVLGAISTAKAANDSTENATQDQSSSDGFPEISSVMTESVWGEFSATTGGITSNGSNTPTGNWSMGQMIVKKAIDSAAIGSGGAGNNEGFNLTPDTKGFVNPIIMFKNMGDYMMTAGATLWTLTTVVDMLPISAVAEAATDKDSAQGGLVGKGSGEAGKSGSMLGKFAGKLLGPVQKLLGLLKFIAPILIGMGLFMAIYIPMIPFITWMGGVVQYSVVVCEGLVGAPIAALSHLDANGDGLGQRTEAGYMFVLNVLFRPALMLFGFFIASALMIILGTVQASMFLGAMANAQGNSVTGFLSILGFITLFFVINVTLIQGLFNMIFLLPDQVLNMIGSRGATTDLGREVEGKMHGMFMMYGRTVREVGPQLAGLARPNQAAARPTARASTPRGTAPTGS